MKPCNLEDLGGWLEAEAGAIVPDAYRRVLLEVNARLDSFVQWPPRPETLPSVALLVFCFAVLLHPSGLSLNKLLIFGR